VEVVTFYRFASLEDPQALQREVHAQAEQSGLKGTVLIAREGINGTLAGEGDSLRAFAAWLGRLEPFAEMEFKYSTAAPDNRVFYRLKIKVKDEIVGFGRRPVDPALRTGERVDAARWNQLLEDPDVLVVDTRNDYEVSIGSFPESINPGTRSFREFAGFVSEGLDPARQPRIAMYCTGGIRCEKASAYLLDQGFEQVYQLEGGILKYLETVAPEDNRWHGECFVFDQRVSVDQALEQGSFEQCFACRHPLSPEDRASEHYRLGVSCPHCIQDLSPVRAAAFEERNRQVAIAQRRGADHIGAQGPDMPGD